MTELTETLLEVVKTRGLQHLPAPVQLASGAISSDFIDAKRALSFGKHLNLACRAIVDIAIREGFEFDVVGGLTLGADPLAHVVAVIADRGWFVVRKTPKGRGTNRLIEGATLEEGVQVLLLDDVVTTGASLRQAYGAVKETGATVVAAITLVDRGNLAAPQFEALGIPYRALFGYNDLSIDPVLHDVVPT